MSNNIVITASMSNILHSLQTTQTNMDTVQNRLATGKKVNSAIDNASSFFIARGLSNRAEDLSSLKDNIIQGMNTIKSATDGLSSIESVLKQMKGIVESAKSASTAAERGKYADQYDALRTEIDNITKDSSYNGVNLLKATPDNMKVTFNESGTSTLTISGVASDSAGLSVSASNDWDNATLATGLTNIDGDLTKINTALTTVRSTASVLGTNNSMLKIRSDFTDNLITTLKAGASNLVDANTTEESANLLALQTRSSMAINSLSMANTQNQSVLSLFR